MSTKSRLLKSSLSIEDKYLREGITDSFKAEKAKITLADLYGLRKNISKDLNFRDRILTSLNYKSSS